ncbi:MAG: SH3 domain-containing protein [Lachnospiraceae bacterium]|nr:SH3 domain-containing protein [Lachnospiraceae bacterium]
MAKRRKSKKNNQWIPVLVAIALIIVIGGGAVGSLLLSKYSYSDEKMDLNENFNITKADEVAIVLQNEHIETKAKLFQGTHYLDFVSMQKLLNDRFYHDVTEGLLLYTTPTEIIRTEVGSSVYTVGSESVETDYQISFYEDETLYVALDYVRNYTNFSYEPYFEPNRMQLTTQWPETTTAEVKRDTQIRYRGGVKSDILREVEKGETVTVLEKMENWTKVKTYDAFIGYVPSKVLKNEETFVPNVEPNYVEPEYTSLTRDYKINMGWHQVMSEAANATLDNAVMANSNMNVISPTWFSLKSIDGDIRCIATQDYVDKAHKMGMEVWALVDNFDKDVSTYQTLSKTTSRTNLIRNLMTQVLKFDIDGINVDFENVSYDAGEPYVQFLRELSIQCRKEGIVLSVDNYVPREYTAHYNRKEQGIVADYVIIMGYDEHWGGGGVAGSVASIGFVEDGIAQTVADVPANKVINAVPFYTRVWKTKGDSVTSEAIDMETAQNFIKNNGVNMSWDPETAQNYGEVEKGNTLYQIWMEDKDSIEAKLAVMRKYNIGGVAAWKLGYETPDIWDMIAKYMDS